MKRMITVLLVLVSFTTSLLLTLPLFAQQKGASPLEASMEVVTGTTRAVVIGISDYQDPDIPDLEFADRDALALAAYLQSMVGGNLPPENIVLLTNKDATTGKIAAAMDWILAESKPADKAILYFSGHGDVEKMTKFQRAFWLTFDTPARVYMAGAFALTSVQDIISTLSENDVQVVLIVDACRAGKMVGNALQGSQATAALMKEFTNEIKILGCQPNEYSHEGIQWGGGRGVFSYHLIDALYGFADRDGDDMVTLLELGHYLENKVVTETAPLVQVPVVYGDRMEVIAKVNQSALSKLKIDKAKALSTFAPVEGRNLEDVVLASVPQNTSQIYADYKNAISRKAFLEPANDCADLYFRQLINEPAIAPLYGYLTRHYAASLQDEAQAAVNALLAVEVHEITQSTAKKAVQYKHFPALLERSAELLGTRHYMYKTLKARQYLFEGLLLYFEHYSDKSTIISQQIIDKWHESLRYEPYMPTAHFYISVVFASKMNAPDSALYHTNMAINLAENWVLPYAYTAYNLTRRYQRFEEAKSLLDRAMAIDSTDVFLWKSLASWHFYQNQNEEAINAFRKAIDLKPDNPIAWTDIGIAYQKAKQYEEAEQAFLSAFRIDSSTYIACYSLGKLYNSTNRLSDAEVWYLKAIHINPTYVAAQKELASIYMQQNKLSAAERQYLDCIKYSPNDHSIWYNLACLAARQGEKGAAIQRLEEALKNGMKSYQHIAKNDPDLQPLRNLPAFQVLLEKYFPEQHKK